MLQISDRTAAIRDMLFTQGEMRLPDLAAALGVSLATIRRDVAALADEGALIRAHGRARLADSSPREVAFAAREQVHLGAKRAIAATALESLRDGESLFLDAGTTVLQVARYLRLQPRQLQLFTNSVAVATELAHLPGVALTLIGGRMRPENLSMVGPFAIEMLNKLWVDRLFLGASALGPDGRLSSHDPDEAQINAAMMRCAKQVHVLADGSKQGLRATYDVGALGPGATLVTNTPPTGALAQNLARAGCQITLTPGTKTPAPRPAIRSLT